MEDVIVALSFLITQPTTHNNTQSSSDKTREPESLLR
jgi:hypothetical protein